VEGINKGPVYRLIVESKCSGNELTSPTLYLKDIHSGKTFDVNNI